MFLGLLGFVSVKNFRKFLASITLNISFYFSSSSGISIICMFHHLHCSGITRYSILSFPFLFFLFLYISLWWSEDIAISSSSLFLSLTAANLLVSPSKVFFISATLFFIFFNDTLFKFASLHLHYPYILGYYRLFTLEPLKYCNYSVQVCISPLTLSLHSWILLTFYIRTFNIL